MMDHSSVIVGGKPANLYYSIKDLENAYFLINCRDFEVSLQFIIAREMLNKQTNVTSKKVSCKSFK